MRYTHRQVLALIAAGLFAFGMLAGTAYILYTSLRPPSAETGMTTLDAEFERNRLELQRRLTLVENRARAPMLAAIPWVNDPAEPLPANAPVAAVPWKNDLRDPAAAWVREISLPRLQDRPNPHQPRTANVAGASLPWARTAAEAPAVEINAAKLPRAGDWPRGGSQTRPTEGKRH